MYLGAYRFAGDPAELIAAYNRMMSGVDPATVDLHVCVVSSDGLVVLDACPSEEVFRNFGAGCEFRKMRRRTGLPEPTIEQLGTVHQALLRQAVRG